MSVRKQVEYLWKYYGCDSKGYLEGKELESFIKELCMIDELKGQEEMVKESLNINGSGKLYFQELLTALGE